MNIFTILSVASIVLNLLLVGLLLYFKKGIEAFIDFRKSKALEKFKRNLDELYTRQQKMALVAELFARKFNKPEEEFEFEKLNWELALFLDRDLVCEISQKLVNAKSKFDVMDLFIKIRESLGIKDGLEANNISYIAQLATKPTNHPE